MIYAAFTAAATQKSAFKVLMNQNVAKESFILPPESLL